MRQLTCLVLLSITAVARAGDVEFFEQHVRPVLVKHCYGCHSAQAKAVRGGLLLDTKAGWQKGGDNGPALVPGDPDKSLLVQAIRYDGEPKMPPAGKLDAKDIDALTAWVKAGAADPRTGAAAAKPGRVIDIDKERQHWAYQPLATAAVPDAGKLAGWCRTPVDRFIAAKLAAKGIAPNPMADRRTLIRRVAFDLTGLPPTPEEVERFLTDPSPDAYANLIDRYLDSPHFGERWARHWLDLARFAESHGYEQDYDRPYAYHYRDFVVKAFNRDLPYDTFVRWQVAGDEIAPDNHQALMATGFLAAGTHATQITANQAEKERYDELDDMARTVGTTMLGMTVGCARCHDHKFDPIPTADYYRLIATFATTVRSDMEMDLDPDGFRAAKAKHDAAHAPLVEALAKYERDNLPAKFERWVLTLQPRPAANDKKLDAVRKIVASLDAEERLPTRAERATLLAWFKTADAEGAKRAKAVADHAKAAPQKPKVLISSEGVPAVRLHTQGLDFYDPVYQLKRGDLNQKGEVAKAGFLRAVTRTADDGRWRADPPGGSKLSFRRTALANWLTDTEAGAGQLLARVIVNRLWYYHMGRGLVATPSDFGTQGERPTHPELLDYLASELIRNGWRLKPIHKLILASAVYAQDGRSDEARAAVDRENLLWWRRPARRLEAEAVRDAILAASGRLDPTMFGPGTLDNSMTRRSLYFFVKRSKLVPMMTLFDAPDSLQDLAVRSTTTIAPQALHLMNNPAVRECAVALAQRAGGVDRAYELALARKPTDEERADAAEFLRGGSLADFCQALLCLNEFVYVD
ncbi:MAG: PSD1 and planctomycete cytochrome C domain-containing protein [Gemmataceae bacterium]